MAKRADEELLAAMHNALAEALIDKIRSGEATASDLNVARQFLKDNNINSDPLPGSPMADLVSNIPFPTGDYSH